MTSPRLRPTGIAAAAVAVLCLGGFVACDDDDKAPEAAAPSTATVESHDAASQAFGPGCDQIPADGKGSFNGMVTDPVVTATGHNPELSALYAAIGEVDDLATKLDKAPALTVFAPTDTAFARIPRDTLDAVLADPKVLGAILSHHVVGETLDQADVVGKHDTLNNDTVTVEGSGDDMTVDGARVLCGNIPTANATVYIIDTVLMPS